MKIKPEDVFQQEIDNNNVRKAFESSYTDLLISAKELSLLTQKPLSLWSKIDRFLTKWFRV